MKEEEKWKEEQIKFVLTRIYTQSLDYIEVVKLPWAIFCAY